MHFVKVVTDAQVNDTYHVLLIDDVEKTALCIKTFEKALPPDAIEYAKLIAEQLTELNGVKVEAIF